LGCVHELPDQSTSEITSAATVQRTHAGAEPVVLLALVENNLQTAGPHHQQTEADVVEGADLSVLDVRRIMDEAADQDDRQMPTGMLNVEGIAPTEGIGEPATQRGPNHRGHHNAQAIGSHRHGALSYRKALKQNRLR